MSSSLSRMVYEVSQQASRPDGLPEYEPRGRKEWEEQRKLRKAAEKEQRNEEEEQQ